MPITKMEFTSFTRKLLWVEFIIDIRGVQVFERYKFGFQDVVHSKLHQYTESTIPQLK